MNKTVISIVVLALIIIGGLFLFSGDKKNTQVENTSSSQPTGVMVDSGQTVIIQGHQIPRGDLEIEVGTTIVWRNKDNLVGLPYDRHTVTSGIIVREGVEGVKGVVPNSGSGISDGMYQESLALNDVFDYTFT